MMPEKQAANPDTDKQTKINERVSIINNGITQLNDQHSRMVDLVRPMIKERPPMEHKEVEVATDELPLLVSNEVDCELIVLLDNIIERQIRLIDSTGDIIERIDV